MLLYNNQKTLRILVNIRGSILYRGPNILVGLILAGACVVLQVLNETDPQYAPQIPNSLGLTVVGMITAFATVFRTNLAWERYWEAWTQAHFMYSKLSDCYSQISVFCKTSVHRAKLNGSKAALANAQWVESITMTFARHMSLFSALVAHRLSQGDTECVDKHFKRATWESRLKLRQELPEEAAHTYVTKHVNMFPELAKQFTSQINDPKVEAPSGHGRGSAYLKQVCGLKEACFDYEYDVLKASSHRPSVVMLWLFASLSELSNELHIPPPIQTRMFQELSDCMVGYRYCEKIADVPFPFPYAQLLDVSLLVYSMLCPFYVSCFTQSMILGPIVTFIIFQLIYGINEVAKQMENPFGKDENDIQLNDFHWRFLDELTDLNRSLAVVSELRKGWNAEIDRAIETDTLWCPRKPRDTMDSRDSARMRSLSPRGSDIGEELVLDGDAEHERLRAQSLQPVEPPAVPSGLVPEGPPMPFISSEIEVPPAGNTQPFVEPPGVPVLLQESFGLSEADDAVKLQAPNVASRPETRRRSEPSAQARWRPPGNTSGNYTEFIDRHFAETFGKMEAHLARIALQCDSFSVRCLSAPDNRAPTRSEAC